jgi:hypothetical protein
MNLEHIPQEVIARQEGQQELVKGLSKPVSRILYSEKIGAVTIHLALMLPSGSSDQPGVGPGVPINPLFGLAPGVVYPAGQSPDRW